MESEAAKHASFDRIRYAQCWEDADILTTALSPEPGDTCVSIASGGDNAIALLIGAPERVVALDLSPAQLACLALRVAAYGELSHQELLELIGSRPSRRRPQLYSRCRTALATPEREFWDAHPDVIDAGIGTAGKFERYFTLFRKFALPLVHSRATTNNLLQTRSREERERFFAQVWNNQRWRAMFAVFFSRTVMGWLGRDPSFFRYVEGSVADRIMARTRHALVELDPSQNPYLHWILTGTHGEALPMALRAEHFDAIRNNIHKIEWRQCSVEAFLDEAGPASLDCFNLSDIFEYMSEENYASLLERIVTSSRRGAMLAYWNMLAPRRRPEAMASRLSSRLDLSKPLFLADKAFFYSDFIVEEVIAG